MLSVTTRRAVWGRKEKAPMQDALALSQSRLKDGAYDIDITCEVTDSRHGSPRIDPNHLREAWNDVAARHAALRTVFLEATTSTQTAMIHQVVLKKYRPSVILIDADNSVNALDRLASCASYKEKGLLVDKSPPHLLATCSTAQGYTFSRFQVNHILFDGTSTTGHQLSAANMPPTLQPRSTTLSLRLHKTPRCL